MRIFREDWYAKMFQPIWLRLTSHSIKDFSPWKYRSTVETSLCCLRTISTDLLSSMAINRLKKRFLFIIRTIDLKQYRVNVHHSLTISVGIGKIRFPWDNCRWKEDAKRINHLLSYLLCLEASIKLLSVIVKWRHDLRPVISYSAEVDRSW